LKGHGTIVTCKTILLLLLSYYGLKKKKYLETIQHLSCSLLALKLHAALRKEVELNLAIVAFILAV